MEILKNARCGLSLERRGHSPTPSKHTSFIFFTECLILPFDPSCHSWLNYLQFFVFFFPRIFKIRDSIKGTDLKPAAWWNFTCTPTWVTTTQFKIWAVSPTTQGLPVALHPPDNRIQYGHFWVQLLLLSIVSVRISYMVCPVLQELVYYYYCCLYSSSHLLECGLHAFVVLLLFFWPHCSSCHVLVLWPDWTPAAYSGNSDF